MDQRITVVSVPVADQDRAKAFYADVLGFEVVADAQFGPDQRWVQVGPHGGGTSLTLVTWFPTMAPGSLKGLVLECADVRAAMDELAGRGLGFEQELQEAPWGTFTTFEDPDGNGWVLQQSAPPQGV
jgi:catechol 2,3-dioxygenase-like lactoylglutathione lyase family enzyme